MDKNTATQTTKESKLDLNTLNTPKCSAFGSIKFNNPACKKCATAFKARKEACQELSKITLAKKMEKKVTGNKIDCFNARIDSDTHKFIQEIYKSPCTMKAIKEKSWNKRPNTFYCKFKTLTSQGYATKNNKSGSLSLTAKGRKKFEKWNETQKAESKKAA